MSRVNSASDALEILVAPFDVTPRWDQVLADAGVGTARRRADWRTVAIAAAVAAGLLAAAAYATGIGDRFSSWLTSPGTPAPAEEQNGFESRNNLAYASFPAGTKLRLLLRKQVDGRSFDLLGFKNGDAYCLRLVRTDLPQGIGRNECLRAEELRGHPALVADDVYFTVGDPAKSFTGVYGFAADDVSAIHVTRSRGEESIPVRNNVFLSLQAQMAGTVQHHPLPNPVLTVAAVLADHTIRNVPYVVQGLGIIGSGKRPTVPSYFGARGIGSGPGLPAVEAPIHRPRVGWLERRESRGAALPPVPSRGGAVTFGRVIQPDPDDPVRVGLAIAPAVGMTHGHPITGNWVCLINFQPLARAAGSEGCFPEPFRLGPLMLGSYYSSAIAHLSGAAADGIARVVARLADGRSVEAALRDNVFTVAVPLAELGGALIGYDKHGRVAGAYPLPTNAVAKPCPPAQLAKPTASLPPPEIWEQIDIGSLSVGGRPILGKTPDQVKAILGTPATTRPRAQITNGVPIPEFRYGGTLPSTMGLSIGFTKIGPKIRASRIIIQSPSTVDKRLGHVLRLQPLELQRAIAKTYGSRYRLFLSYGSDPRIGCSGTFAGRHGAAGIGFALPVYRPSRPVLTFLANAGG